MAFAWLWPLFIYSFITYILFTKKRSYGKSRMRTQHSSRSPCLCSTPLLIKIQSPKLYNMRILNKESFK